MDLPEKLLPRISSRMGIQRLCFAPYNYMQLQEIIGCRLKGIDAFEKQAIEFASRKVHIYTNCHQMDLAIDLKKKIDLHIQCIVLM